MKKLILILALATGLSTLTYAKGDKKTPEQKAAHNTEVLKKKLNLNAEQTAKVKAIMLSEANETAALKKSKPKNEKEAHDAIKQRADQKLGTVFTAEQKRGYEAWKTDKKEKKAQKKKEKAEKKKSAKTKSK